MVFWMASFVTGNYLVGMPNVKFHKFDFKLHLLIMVLMLGLTILLFLVSPILNKAMEGIH